jgi:hypothetical protein
MRSKLIESGKSVLESELETTSASETRLKLFRGGRKAARVCPKGTWASHLREGERMIHGERRQCLLKSRDLSCIQSQEKTPVYHITSRSQVVNT